MRSLHAGCRMPLIPAEAAPTPPCPLMTNFLVSRLSFFVRPLSSVVYRPSSIVLLFVPLRFAIIFYSKIFSIEPTHGEHHLPLTDEQWAKLEPLIHPPESSASRGRLPIDERRSLNDLDYANQTNWLHPIYPNKLVLQINAPTCTVTKHKKPPHVGVEKWT